VGLSSSRAGWRIDRRRILIKNGVVDSALFFDGFGSIVDNTWKHMETYTALERRLQRDPAIYENFEYLTVRAREWTARHRAGTYPKGVARIKLADPPVSPERPI